MQTKGYRPGDRVFYRNSYGQDFYATVTSVFRREDGGGNLLVKREDWPRDECIDLDDYVLSRHFPQGR